MEGTKQYRFADNPKEKEFHDKFIKQMMSSGNSNRILSAIVYGWSDDWQNVPAKYLNTEGETICINLIQWLGSPVGQGFLDECGFEPKNSYHPEKD